MFQKVKVAVLGVIENMSLYHCPACGHVDAIFGVGAADFIESHDQVPILGALPLSRVIREDSDQGCPSVLCEGRDDISQSYLSIAQKMLDALALCKKEYASVFPKIVVE